MNPELDLVIERVIKAPRDVVWRAWTTPDQLEQWWIPAPTTCRVERFEPHAGGAFVTSMAEPGGEFTGHLDACFLTVEEGKRIAFTTALDSTWRPKGADSLCMTGEFNFEDHPDGTRYRAVARHANPADCARHAQLGFEEGWGAVTEQLAAIVERMPVG